MSGSMVQFPVNGHTCDGYLSLPPKGTGPGLIVIQEWWGLVDHIKTLADRFAAEGFVALAPDMYHGERTTSPDQAGKLLMALNIAEAGKDMRGAAEYLRANGSVKPKRVATLGFCMGGQLALYAAQEHPDVIDAAVDFYGIHPKVEIVPARVKVPVLGHFATRDKSVPLESVHAMAAECVAAGGKFEVHEYDADHAFFNDTRPQVYNASAATLAFARTLTFLRKALVCVLLSVAAGILARPLAAQQIRPTPLEAKKNAELGWHYTLTVVPAGTKPSTSDVVNSVKTQVNPPSSSPARGHRYWPGLIQITKPAGSLDDLLQTALADHQNLVVTLVASGPDRAMHTIELSTEQLTGIEKASPPAGAAPGKTQYWMLFFGYTSLTVDGKAVAPAASLDWMK